MCLLGKIEQHFSLGVHIVRKLEFLGSFHNIVEIDPGARVHASPDENREVEKERLTHQNKRNPLVVYYGMFLTVLW